VTAADQVLKEERASARQRRQTGQIIKRACREGRITKALRDSRITSARDTRTTKTTAELRRLTSDLGESEQASAFYWTAIAGCALAMLAAWEPVLLDGPAWYFLAVPVTVIMLILMLALSLFQA
jgi:hypothetical protein